jgi:hypothetical protein
MRHLKFVGLAAIAAAALMAFAGPASATILTGPGGSTLGAGTAIAAVNEGMVVFHASIGTVECNGSSLGGKITNAGGTGVAVSTSVETLSFSACNATVTVLSKGTFSIEGTGGNNGTLRGSNNELTIEFSGLHCIYRTNGTTLGAVTGSSTTGATATMDISARIPRTGGRSGVLCLESVEWTAAYKITSPDFLNVDK